MSRGSKWEAAIAAENQHLYGLGRAMVARVPTHYHGGAPSRDPKVDFVGLLAGGRMVAIEAKSDSGQLSESQRAYLAGVAKLGGVAVVYRHVEGERHLCLVSTEGKMQRKGEKTLTTEGTWLDALIERAIVIEERL